jgi:hypothetical protein
MAPAFSLRTRHALKNIALLLCIAMPLHFARATGVDDIVGTWDMLHDGRAGTLVIFPPDQHLVAVNGACTYSYWVINGQWTASNGGGARPVSGTFQGEDQNIRSGGCKNSGHIVQMTVDFGSGATPQPFTGYIFQTGNRAMAGYTWWNSITFGWFATKR